MKKTIEALVKLSNDSLFLKKSLFPNSKNAERCRRSLVQIEEITNKIIASEENLSKTYLKTLKTNFTKYLNSDDDVIPNILLNKRSVKQIISHFNDTKLYSEPLCKSQDMDKWKKIIFLIESASTSKDIVKEISICFLKFYYTYFDSCSDLFLTNLTNYLEKYYPVKYYLLQNDFIPLFSQYDNSEDDYLEFLRNIKINTNFISTKFFQELWGIWCLTRKASTYTEKFINKNKDRINSEREDARKCILAVITCKIYKLSHGNNVIKNELLPMFGSSNPTDENFWKISDKELEKNYGNYLKEVPRLYFKYFAKTFLEVFFNVLETGQTAYSKQTERAIFWESYIDDITNFKIAVNSYYDRLLLEGLRRASGDTKYYLQFYRTHKISIEHSGPAALLMYIKHYLAIEFTEHGNAGYIYYKDSITAKKLFGFTQILDVSVYKNQYSRDCAYRIFHRYGWQREVRYFLNHS